MAILTLEQQELVRKLMQSHFWFFCKCLMSSEWFDVNFHKALCEFMQRSGPHKLIVLPRTHLKTTICATLYPLWKASNNTDLRVLVVSNTSPNAEKTIRGIRSVVETNKVYQAFFPECIPEFNKVRWSDRCACLNRKNDYPEGTFEGAGVGANIIRRHFNLIIEDDTVAPKRDDLSGEECMPSKDDIDQAIGFHKLTTPLLIQEHDEQVVIGTRWASYDHINYIKENEHYPEFDKPAINEEGTSLYKRFSLARLDAIRIGMGSYLFSSLYLNKPLAQEFMTFKPSWVRYYEESELPEAGQGIVTYDPADPPTGKRRQDYSAIVSCSHTKKGIFVRRIFRGRITDRQGIDKCIEFAIQDEATKIRVEVDRYAHLQFAIRERMEQLKVHYIIEAVKTKGRNKEGRIRQRLQPMFENGVIFLKRGMNELEDELFTFPNGQYDDLLDALAWQVEGVYPTELDVPKVKLGRRLPTVGEMLDTIYKRGRTSRYPFERQLNPRETDLISNFNN